jgi:hypothetical protein
MNTVHMISRLLVVTVFAFAGNAVGTTTMKDGVKIVIDLANSKKFSIIGNIVADRLCDKDNHLGKAFVETISYTADGVYGAENLLEAAEMVNPTKLGTYFTTNFAIREAGAELNKRGYDFKYAAEKCDILPEAVGGYVNPVVRTIAQQLTRPEVLTCVALYVIKKSCVAQEKK